ncbi:hypothetical protein M434DRAFT_401860 [Hypoxylon sp. CO27-5]|nr:hypothetical protein M434DRAFT_401860 [Hypoxylon sp. CO27-5]
MHSDSEESFELPDDSSDTYDDSSVTRNNLTRSQALNLYVSHAFSTWNARGYEFAAVCLPIGKKDCIKLSSAHQLIRSSSPLQHIQIPS